MKEMNWASILEVLVGSLVSALSYNNAHIRELESPLVSNKSEFEAAAAEFQSTKLLLRFTKDVGSVMREQVHSQSPQLRRVEAARVATKAARAAADYHFQSPTTSKFALQGEVTQLTQRAGKLGDKVSRTRHECDCKM